MGPEGFELAAATAATAPADLAGQLVGAQRGAATIGPEPELVSAVWDDEAFRDYFAEHRDTYAAPRSRTTPSDRRRPAECARAKPGLIADPPRRD